MTAVEELLVEQEEQHEHDSLPCPEWLQWDELGSHALEVHR